MGYPIVWTIFQGALSWTMIYYLIIWSLICDIQLVRDLVKRQQNVNGIQIDYAYVEMSVGRETFTTIESTTECHGLHDSFV